MTDRALTRPHVRRYRGLKTPVVAGGYGRHFFATRTRDGFQPMTIPLFWRLLRILFPNHCLYLLYYMICVTALSSHELVSTNPMP